MIPRPTEVRVTLDDERRNFEYVVRIVFTFDSANEEAGSAVRIERIEVLEARQLADDGRVLTSDTSPSVRKHDERIWELLEDDPTTLETVEEECRLATDRRPVAGRPATGRWMQRIEVESSREQRGAG